MAIEIGTLIVRGSFGRAGVQKEDKNALDEEKVRRMMNDLRRSIRRDTEEMISRVERHRREG